MINVQSYHSSSTPLTILPYFFSSDLDTLSINKLLLYVFPSRLELYHVLRFPERNESLFPHTCRKRADTSPNTVELCYLTSHDLTCALGLVETIHLRHNVAMEKSIFHQDTLAGIEKDVCPYRNSTKPTLESSSESNFNLSSLIVCLTKDKDLLFLRYNSTLNCLQRLCYHSLSCYTHVSCCNKQNDSQLNKSLNVHHETYAAYSSSISGDPLKLRYTLHGMVTPCRDTASDKTGDDPFHKCSSQSVFSHCVSSPMTLAIQIHCDRLIFLSFNLAFYHNFPSNSSALSIYPPDKPDGLKELLNKKAVHPHASIAAFSLSALKDLNLKSLIDFCFVDISTDSSLPYQVTLCFLGSSSPISNSCVSFSAGNIYVLVISLNLQSQAFYVLRRYGSFPTDSFSILPLPIPRFSAFSKNKPLSVKGLQSHKLVLLILSRYMVIVVPFLDQSNGQSSLEEFFSEFVQIIHPTAFSSTRLTEWCLYISEASYNAPGKKLLRRSLTFQEMREMPSFPPQFGSSWFLNRPTLDSSSLNRLDLAEYHWVFVNCFLHLLVPKHSGPLYIANLIMDPCSCKFYGFTFTMLRTCQDESKDYLMYCDTEPKLFQSNEWSDSCCIVFPGHTVDGLPPSVWEFSLNFIDNSCSDTPDTHTQDFGVTANRGYLIRSLDPSKVLKLIHRSSANSIEPPKNGFMLCTNQEDISLLPLKLFRSPHLTMIPTCPTTQTVPIHGSSYFSLATSMSYNKNPLVSVGLFDLKHKGQLWTEPHLGFPRDSFLISSDIAASDPSCYDFVLGVITGCQKYCKLVEMRSSVGSISSVVDQVPQGFSFMSTEKIPVCFDGATYLWNLPCVNEEKARTGSTSLIVLTSDPSNDIGRTDVYTLTLHNLDLTDSTPSPILASPFKEGFDADSATIGCGTLFPFFSCLGEEQRKDLMEIWFWVQVTPTEIRCIHPKTPHHLMEPSIDFLSFQPNSLTKAQTFVDACLAVHALVVRNVVAVLFESLQVYLWFLDSQDVNESSLPDQSSRFDRCILNLFDTKNTQLGDFLAQPFRSFHLTSWIIDDEAKKKLFCQEECDQNVYSHFLDLYLTVIPLNNPESVFVVSLFHLQVVFLCRPSVSKSILFNECCGETFNAGTFLLPSVEGDNTLDKGGNILSTPLSDGLVKAELIWLNDADVGPTLICLTFEGFLLIYRCNPTFFSRASVSCPNQTSHVFPYSFHLFSCTSSLHEGQVNLYPYNSKDTDDHTKASMSADLSFIFALCRFGALVVPFPQFNGRGDTTALMSESLSLLRLPQINDLSEGYQLQETMFLATKSNKLFIHRQGRTLEAPRILCATPYLSVEKEGSWITMSEDSLLRVHSIASFLIPRVRHTVCLWCPTPLTQICLPLDYCVRATFEKELGFLACADVKTSRYQSGSESTSMERSHMGCKTSVVKVFDIGEHMPQWLCCTPETKPSLRYFGEYQFEATERVCSVSFVKDAENIWVIAAGTCLYPETDRESVLGRVYILECPAQSWSSESPTSQLLALRVVKLFPGPVLCLGTLYLPRTPPLLVHTAGRRLFVNKLTLSGLSSGAFFDCPSCIIAMAFIKSYFILADAITGPHFVMFRFTHDSRSSIPPFSLLARVSPARVCDGVLHGLAVEYISFEQTLYILTCDSRGCLDVLQYPIKGSSLPQHQPLATSRTSTISIQPPTLTCVTSLAPFNGGEGSVLRFHRREMLEPRRLGCLIVTAFGGVHSICVKPPALADPVS